MFRWHGGTWYALPCVRLSTDRLSARSGSVTQGSYDRQEREVRDFFRALADETDYEKGHIDPYAPVSDDNIVPQPASLNGGWKNQYRLDRHGLPFSHAPEFLLDDPARVGRYYTPEDCVMIIRAMTEFLASKANERIGTDDDGS